MAHSAQVSFEPGPQPAGREPAPGALGLVQAFVNTSFDLSPERFGAEILDGPDGLARWLRERGLLDRGARLGARDVRRAIVVREGIRALLTHNNDGELDGAAIARMERAVRRPGFTVTYDGRGTREVAPVARDTGGALGLIVALVHESMREGTWARFKACREHHCRWAFYDHSRNQAGAWCTMQICGSRDKARSYRRRHQPYTERR